MKWEKKKGINWSYLTFFSSSFLSVFFCSPVFRLSLFYSSVIGCWYAQMFSSRHFSTVFSSSMKNNIPTTSLFFSSCILFLFLTSTCISQSIRYVLNLIHDVVFLSYVDTKYLFLLSCSSSLTWRIRNTSDLYIR